MNSLIEQSSGLSALAAHSVSVHDLSRNPAGKPQCRFASFPRRVFAHLLDLTAGFTIAVLVLRLLDLANADSVRAWLYEWPIYLIILAYLVLLAAYGGPIGKRLLGTRVVDQHGNNPGLWRSLRRVSLLAAIPAMAFGLRIGLRWFPDVIADPSIPDAPIGLGLLWFGMVVLSVSTYIVTCFWSLQDEHNQTWLDKMAGTYVVRSK